MFFQYVRSVDAILLGITQRWGNNKFSFVPNLDSQRMGGLQKKIKPRRISVKTNFKLIELTKMNSHENKKTFSTNF